jgi:hypothetical protein
MLTLDSIVDLLNQYHQRASYGAVAAVLSRVPRSLLQGRKKDRRHSWVVNQETGMPTGYHTVQMHPALEERANVLDTEASLRKWLSNPT